jgi:hypothetical protein
LCERVGSLLPWHLPWKVLQPADQGQLQIAATYLLAVARDSVFAGRRQPVLKRPPGIHLPRPNVGSSPAHTPHTTALGLTDIERLVRALVGDRRQIQYLLSVSVKDEACLDRRCKRGLEFFQVPELAAGIEPVKLGRIEWFADTDHEA